MPAPSERRRGRWRAVVFAAMRIRFRLILLIACALALIVRPARARSPEGWRIVPKRPAWVVDVEPGPVLGPESGGLRRLLFDQQSLQSTVGHTYVRTLNRITQEVGLTASSQVVLSFDPASEELLIHAVSVHRNGETLDRLSADGVRIVQRETNLEAQVVDGRKSAVLFVSDLRVGDALEVAYSVVGADPTLDGHLAMRIMLGGSEPIGRVHQRLIDGRRRKLRVVEHGTANPGGPTPENTPLGNAYAWNGSEVPAYPSDAGSPAWFRPFPWVEISDFDTWEEVSRWGARRFEIDGHRSKELLEWIREAKAASASSEAYLLRATRFVQDEVRYVGLETGLSRRTPAAPDVVFARRHGDCKDKSALLAALLRAGGLEADVALASLQSGHVLAASVPSATAFDHAIVVVRGEQTLWIDATASLQGGGVERFRASRLGPVLPLTRAGSSLETPPMPNAEAESIQVSDALVVSSTSEDAQATFESERVYRGEVADVIRGQLRARSAAETTTSILSSYQSRLPGVREVAPMEVEDDREHDRLRLLLHLAVSHFWSADTTKTHFSVTTSSPTIEALLPQPTSNRTAPLALVHPVRVRHRVELGLPIPVTTLEPATTISDEAFELRSTSDFNQKKLVATHEFSTKASEVTTANLAVYATRATLAREKLVRTVSFAARGAPEKGFNWPILGLLAAGWAAIGFAAVKVYRLDYRRRRAVAAPPPIGGGLVVLALGILLNPLLELASLARILKLVLSRASWSTIIGGSVGARANLPALLLVEAFIFSWLLAHAIVLIPLFFRRRRTFRRHFQVFATAILVVHLGDTVIGGTMVSSAHDEVVSFAVRRCIWAGFWLLFVSVSQRVKKTFTVPVRSIAASSAPTPRSMEDRAA